MSKILLIDDEPRLCQVVSMLLVEHGHEVLTAESGARALECAHEAVPDAALIDVNLPGMTGLETFLALRQIDAQLPGIFITGSGSVATAIAAMKAGATDYVTKPFDNAELLLILDRALETRQLRREVGLLREEVDARQEFPGIVGRSPAVRELLRRMPRIARTDTPVLIFGESGTGKELVARNVHQHSQRSNGPFVAVNCAAIPAGLVESEFFGHERGAFTDARDLRVGRFEQAHRGSLFLDEIGELPREAQAKLLRALEEGQVTRVGGRRSIPADVRVIAATNSDLAQDVRRGAFREDLYWRLNVLPVSLPPLRERGEDLALLIDYYVETFNEELGTRILGVTDDARSVLLAHGWPGNIRELQNALKRSMIFADGPRLTSADVRHIVPTSGADGGASEGLTLAETVARTVTRVERAAIEATLNRHRGSRTATAEALGINRKTLFNKMRSYGLSDESEPGDE